MAANSITILQVLPGGQLMPVRVESNTDCVISKYLLPENGAPGMSINIINDFSIDYLESTFRIDSRDMLRQKFPPHREGLFFLREPVTYNGKTHVYNPDMPYKFKVNEHGEISYAPDIPESAWPFQPLFDANGSPHILQTHPLYANYRNQEALPAQARKIRVTSNKIKAAMDNPSFSTDKKLDFLLQIKSAFDQQLSSEPRLRNHPDFPGLQNYLNSCISFIENQRAMPAAPVQTPITVQPWSPIVQPAPQQQVPTIPLFAGQQPLTPQSITPFAVQQQPTPEHPAQPQSSISPHFIPQNYRQISDTISSNLPSSEKFRQLNEYLDSLQRVIDTVRSDRAATSQLEELRKYLEHCIQTYNIIQAPSLQQQHARVTDILIHTGLNQNFSVGVIAGQIIIRGNAVRSIQVNDLPILMNALAPDGITLSSPESFMDGHTKFTGIVLSFSTPAPQPVSQQQASAIPAAQPRTASPPQQSAAAPTISAQQVITDSIRQYRNQILAILNDPNATPPERLAALNAMVLPMQEFVARNQNYGLDRELQQLNQHLNDKIRAYDTITPIFNDISRILADPNLNAHQKLAQLRPIAEYIQQFTNKDVDFEQLHNYLSKKINVYTAIADGFDIIHNIANDRTLLPSERLEKLNALQLSVQQLSEANKGKDMGIDANLQQLSQYLNDNIAAMRAQIIVPKPVLVEKSPLFPPQPTAAPVPQYRGAPMTFFPAAAAPQPTAAPIPQYRSPMPLLPVAAAPLPQPPVYRQQEMSLVAKKLKAALEEYRFKRGAEIHTTGDKENLIQTHGAFDILGLGARGQDKVAAAQKVIDWLVKNNPSVPLDLTSDEIKAIEEKNFGSDLGKIIAPALDGPNKVVGLEEAIVANKVANIVNAAKIDAKQESPPLENGFKKR